MIRKIFRLVFLSAVLVGLIGAVAGGVVGMYFYIRYTRDLPQIESLKDYRPKAVSSIYANDGTLIAEVFDESGRRYPVEFRDIPKLVRNAFLAAEDASFYSHPGIDPISILRATYKNLLKHKAKQGASTITQQTVKSLLLTREKSLERKVKEAILSYRLEHSLTKDEIFAIYLNEIYLGSGSNGVAAAAKVHFHKRLDELSIAEAAFLGGLPQRPSELTNPKNREVAIDRQHYVVDQMLKNEMITKEQADAAKKEKLTIYPPDEQTIFAAPYFSSHVMNAVLPPIFEKIDKYSSPTNPGGYKIYTTVDLHATELATASLQRGVREVDKRQGWRGPIAHLDDANHKAQAGTEHLLSPSDLRPNTVYRAIVEKAGPEAGRLAVRVGAVEGRVDLKHAEWARRFKKGDQVMGIDPAKVVRTGDVIEVSLEEPAPEKAAASGAAAKKEEKPPLHDDIVNLKLDQTPELEGAFLAASPLTGEVKAMIGGYDYRRNQFNRVTQARRQPGSSFKPFIYLAALEQLGFTPSTIVPDEPISLVAGDGKMWTPGNFDGKFLGPITLRTALQRSRNVVSVYMIQQMGVQRAIESARRLGLTTPIPPNLSISLGSAEVEMLELVRAYGAFASGGLLADSLFVTKILDRDGHVVYEQEPHGRRVINEEDAYVMASMMKGVVERGTATVLKVLGRPMAGKTGTTNDQMDAWFVGYTPEFVGGAWVGYDVKRKIGNQETGGKAAAPIMLYFLQEYLKGVPPSDFPLADGVIPVPVDLNSGRPVSGDAPGAFTEYFKSGTEPAGRDAEAEEAGTAEDEAAAEPSDESPEEARVPARGEPAAAGRGAAASGYLSNDEF